MGLTIEARIALRKNVKNFIVKNKDAKKSEIIKHFQKEGFIRQTINNTVNRLVKEEALLDKKRTGRQSTWTPQRTAKLKRLTNNKSGISQRKLGNVFHVHQTTVSRKLKNIKIKYRKRGKTPKYSDTQSIKSKKLSRTNEPSLC